MTGPDHNRMAEELAANARDYLGQGSGRYKSGAQMTGPHWLVLWELTTRCQWLA